MTKSKKAYREKIGISPGLREIAAKLCELREEGRRLGMFMEERELLQCQKCKLLEDVLFNGRLVVYKEGEEIEDTGLRFKPLDDQDNFFECPLCKTKVLCSTHD